MKIYWPLVQDNINYIHLNIYKFYKVFQNFHLMYTDNDSWNFFVKGIPYEVTVWTSDISKAGTDANVFIQMYGTDGKTDEIVLNNRSDNFERGMKEKFKVRYCLTVKAY